MTSTPRSAEIANPPADGMAAPAEFTGGGRLSRLEPGASLVRHKRLAFVLFLLITLCGLPVAYFKGKAVYSTQAVVYVSPHFTRNAEGVEQFQLQSDPAYREYVKQNVHTIRRFDIAQETLKRLDEKGQRSWRLPREDDRHAAERLAGALIISPAPETYQVNVGLRGDRPEGLADAVNTLLDVYVSVQKAEEFYGVESRLAALRQELDRVGKQLSDDEQRRSQLAQDAGVGSFSESHANPHDQLLASARQALAEARRQRIAAEEQFGVVDPARGAATRPALDSFALDMARKDRANAPLLSGSTARRAELSARLNRLSPDQPGRKEIQRELADLDAERQRNQTRLSSEYSSLVLERRRAEMLRTQRIEKALAGELAQQEARESSFDAKYREGLGLSQRIEQARKRQESMEEQRRSLELVGRVPGSIRVFAKAQPASRVSKSRRIELTLIFTLAGLVVALLVPVVLDLLDPRLLVPSDAARALRADPLGWLPEREEGGSEFTWELLLRLANRIDEERQALHARVWMFTSVKSGGGTTTLVNSLGRALTMLGVPTLSVEANAYRADGRFSGNSAGPGLTMLLRGHSTLSESIVIADREMPDHIPVGELDGRGHLPDIHRLMEILGESSESYALVLVDIPPLLLSVDSEYLARRADCVVLVAEARRVTSPELKRAAKVLKRVQSKRVACVLNRVHAADGGGFAQDAKREFETGAGKPMPSWRQPWLWK